MELTKFYLWISWFYVAFSAASACLLLGSCASTKYRPPPPGSAIIEAKPDPERRKHVEGIELVSINGSSVKGTRSVIQPGPNTVKTRFRWPQGQVQEADLRFYATPGIVYFINYDMYPSYNKLTGNDAGSAAGKAMNTITESGDPYAGLLGLAVVAPVAAVTVIGEQIIYGVTQVRQSPTYIDLAVVAHYSSQGTVRKVRAYPDGRVDEKPWAAWAQMKAP